MRVIIIAKANETANRSLKCYEGGIIRGGDVK